MTLSSKLLFSALAMSLAVLVFSARAAAAPPKPKIVDEPVETRFCLYALEDLYSSTWPDAKSVGTSRLVRSIIAQRERIVHDLVDRVKEGELGGEHCKEIVEMFELHMKFVRERGEKLSDELDRQEAAIRKKWLEIYKRVDAEAAGKRLENAGRFTLGALDYLSKPSDQSLNDFYGTVAISLLEEAKIQRDVYGKARKEWNEFIQIAKPEYERNVKEGIASLVRDVGADREERRKTATALAKTLAESRKWKPTDTPFVAGASTDERASDLFRLLRKIEAEPITTNKGESEEAANRLEKAKKYLKAVDLVPRASHKGYHFFRAVCYSMAGEEANLSATLTFGTDGFSAKKPNEASKLSLEAWKKFDAHNDRDLNGDTLRHYALALAYNGRALDAYALVKANSKFCPVTAGFYYDIARIYSVAAEDFAKLTPQAQRQLSDKGIVRIFFGPVPANSALVQDSSLAFDRAVQLGFKDIERAKNIRDLKELRAADDKVLRPRRTFDQIVGDK